jgi:hypothetical protein
MIYSMTLQQEIGVTICGWLLIITVLLIAALWTTMDRETKAPSRNQTAADVLHSAQPVPAESAGVLPGSRPGPCRDSSSRGDPEFEWGTLRAIEGTLQRVDYPKHELRVVALGKVWYFTVDSQSLLRFDDRPAILRCFHPLDAVKIIYAEGEPRHAMRAMYAWEKQRATSEKNNDEPRP